MGVKMIHWQRVPKVPLGEPMTIHDPHSQVDLLHKTDGALRDAESLLICFLHCNSRWLQNPEEQLMQTIPVVARMFRGCFEDVSRMFQGHAKKITHNPLENANPFNSQIHHSVPNQRSSEIRSHQGITWTEI